MVTYDFLHVGITRAPSTLQTPRPFPVGHSAKLCHSLVVGPWGRPAASVGTGS